MEDSGANDCPCASLPERHPGQDLGDLPELKARVAPRGAGAEDRIQRYECPACGQKWEVHAIELYNAPSAILLKVDRWSPWPFDPQTNRLPDAAPPVPAPPPGPERTWWRQVRLRTAVVLMFVASGVLYLNVAEKPALSTRTTYPASYDMGDRNDPGAGMDDGMGATWARESTWSIGWPDWFVQQTATEEKRTFQIEDRRSAADPFSLAESYKDVPFKAQQVSYSPIRYGSLAFDIAVLFFLLFACFLVLEGFRPLKNWLGWVFSK